MIPRVSSPADTTARVKTDLDAFGKIAKEVDLKPM